MARVIQCPHCGTHVVEGAEDSCPKKPPVVISEPVWASEAEKTEHEREQEDSAWNALARAVFGDDFYLSQPDQFGALD